MEQITKLCADSLRTFTDDTYGIKLKASHAHEIVAALFGYKSRAALLADTTLPLSQLPRAEFIIHDPTPCNTGFVDQRLKDFGYSMNAFHLADHFRTTLGAETWIKDKLYLSFREVAIHVAEQRLNRQLKMLGVSRDAFGLDVDGNMLCWAENGDAILTADATYFTDNNEKLRYSSYSITIPRSSANLGYGEPSKVEEVLYAGQARRLP